MSRLPSTASIVARQVRIVVSPPTTTLFESSAILSALQTRFGPVSTFANQRNDIGLNQSLKKLRSEAAPASNTPSQSILAIFQSPKSKSSALDARSLEIECGGDLLPSPAERDPFNIRGHHGRHHPPKRRFSCSIIDENDPSVYQLMMENNQKLHARTRSNQYPETADNPSLDGLAGGLMNAWRDGMKNGVKNGGG